MPRATIYELPKLKKIKHFTKTNSKKYRTTHSQPFQIYPYIQTDWDIQTMISRTLDSFIQSLKLCLNSTYFKFIKYLYSHIYGTRQPVSASIANLELEELKYETFTIWRIKYCNMDIPIGDQRLFTLHFADNRVILAEDEIDIEILKLQIKKL